MEGSNPCYQHAARMVAMDCDSFIWQWPTTHAMHAMFAFPISSKFIMSVFLYNDNVFTYI